MQLQPQRKNGADEMLAVERKDSPLSEIVFLLILSLPLLFCLLCLPGCSQMPTQPQSLPEPPQELQTPLRPIPAPPRG